LISICIPTYNTDCSPLLDELHNQKDFLDKDYEVIVLDDCSNLYQNLIEKKCTDNNFTYFRNDQNLGRVATRVKLAKKSKYTYLLFIDADMIPKRKSFLKKYQDFIFSKDKVIFGGYAYKQSENKAHFLRSNYGKKREEKKAKIRSKSPYKHIYSGNVLIEKKLFLETNHIDQNRYGLDYSFSISLKKLKIKPVHIDNETYHMGIERNVEFLEKSKEGVKTMFWMYKNNLMTEHDNNLVYTYKTIERWHLLGLFKKIGRLIIKPVERLLAKNKAPLFFFDFYRLYFFSIN
jgi:glycosyltransferase involved in cell wall biosynthesis